MKGCLEYALVFKAPMRTVYASLSEEALLKVFERAIEKCYDNPKGATRFVLDELKLQLDYIARRR